MTLLIRRAKMVGASHDGEDVKDVLVTGDRISAIGDFPTKSADVILEAQGAYCAPGFIDVNTDSDHYLSLFDHPSQADFLLQGVTTILGGMCGASLAPLLYGSLESVRKWGDISKVNVNWHSLQDLFETLAGKKLGVNFGTLVGHSTIRRALIGESLRDLTENELGVFENALREALAQGALGLSTGLGYVHGFRTPYAEIKRLCRLLKEYNGVYATHLRKTGLELSSSIDETLRAAKDTGVKTVISHFTPLMGSEVEYEKALGRIESLPENISVKFDVYPSDTSVLAIYTFLPLWAQNGGLETMLANLKDEWLQTRIERDLPDMRPDVFTVAQAPGNEFLVGKTLKDIANMYDLASYKAALRKLMQATALKAVVFYKNINGSLIERAVRSPKSFIASNAASFPDTPRILKPERARTTFTTYLELEASDNSPLEEAVDKITSEPARYFGLEDRGELREGAIADITVFTLRRAAGARGRAEIQHVVISGEPALQDGAVLEKRLGKIVRRPAKYNG